MRVMYITVVWGDKYLDTFLNYVIPSIVYNKNKDAIKSNEYVIYTDDEGKAKLKDNDTFKYLSNICTVYFKQLIGSGVKKKLIACINDAIINAFEFNMTIKIVAPDVIYSNGALINALNKIKEGYGAVIFPAGGVRVKESFLEEYSTDLTAKEFRDLFIKHMHIETKQHFIDAKDFIPFPVMRIEKKDNELLIKSFYHQPEYIKPVTVNRITNAELNMVDGIANDKIYCLKDSDEYMSVSVTGEKFSNWGENVYNEQIFMDYNKENINRVSQLSFDSGFIVK